MLRPARPDIDDAVIFAALTEAAAAGLFSRLLGNAAPRVLAAVFREPGHNLSYDRTIVGELDGEIAGMASHHSAPDYRAGARLAVRLMTRSAGWRAFRMAIAVLPVRRTLAFMDKIADGDHYLQMVAVRPDYRGKGVGTALINAVTEHAAASGARRLVLDVETENAGAQALYGRLGFVVTETSRRASRLMGGVRVNRMARAL